MHTVLVYPAVQKQILWYTDILSLEMSWTSGYFQKELGEKRLLLVLFCVCVNTQREVICAQGQMCFCGVRK